MLREDKVKLNEMTNQMAHLKGTEVKSKEAHSKVLDLQAIIEALRKELAKEKQDKRDILSEKEEMRMQTCEVSIYTYCMLSKYSSV